MKPTNEQITAAARALSKDNADTCNVNREDNWMIYGDSFRETARVALEAAMGVAPDVDAGARDEREAFEAFMQASTSRSIIRDSHGFYVDFVAYEWWKVWQARAALSTPPPAKLSTETVDKGMDRLTDEQRGAITKAVGLLRGMGHHADAAALHELLRPEQQ